MSIMKTAIETGFGMTKARAKGLCNSPEAHKETGSRIKSGMTDTKYQQGGAKCFTSEAKVKQESNEINNL
jgi:hypothetical protein